MRLPCRILPALGLLVTFSGVAPALRAVDRDYVVVSATAAPEYKRRKGPDGIMAESYVFSPGLQFGGTTRDRTQEKLPFLTVAQTLAASLARQKYLPAKDPAAANLAIIVHWGSTEVFEDFNRQSDLEALNKQLATLQPGAGPKGEVGDDSERQRVNAPAVMNEIAANEELGTNRAGQYLEANAELLGFKRTLNKERQRMFSSTDEETIRAELAEERYFVVLMAYDYQLLKKEKKARLLWVTRMSVRSPGNNFAESVPGMARVAANFFGQQHDDISRVKTDLREGKVEIGELKVIETGLEIAPPRQAP